MKTQNPLKLARLRRGLTQSEAAALLGVALSSVYFWEAGRKLPKKENLIKIKKVFKVEPVDMLGL